MCKGEEPFASVRNEYVKKRFQTCVGFSTLPQILPLSAHMMGKKVDLPHFWNDWRLEAFKESQLKAILCVAAICLDNSMKLNQFYLCAGCFKHWLPINALVVPS